MNTTLRCCRHFPRYTIIIKRQAQHSANDQHGRAPPARAATECGAAEVGEPGTEGGVNVVPAAAGPGVDLDKVKRTRVIGIMAHIDAGKTTTTERMLYYSGFQHTIGEVHHGDTTMDFLQQERDRGITIQSAAASFPWLGHTVSLVDTPGHVDFTVEVERCIRVVDGAVAVLDASAGVEAQTVTVWQQANRYAVPRLCYLNKMDKPAACVDRCLDDLKTRLKANPLLMQVAVGEGKTFTGVVDLPSRRKLTWSRDTADHGASYTVSAPITQSSDPDLYATCEQWRQTLCEQIADLDDQVAEFILDEERLDTVPSTMLYQAVRRATLAQLCVPVFLGSSYKNTGVQALLDAIVNFLPSPLDRLPAAAALYAPHLCALAFKTVYDRQRGGILTYARVYTGTLEQGDRLYNVSKQYNEKPTRLYSAFAADLRETRWAGPGSIVVVAGLKKTNTGDTLIGNKSLVKRAREILVKRRAKSGNKEIASAIRKFDTSTKKGKNRISPSLIVTETDLSIEEKLDMKKDLQDLQYVNGKDGEEEEEEEEQPFSKEDTEHLLVGVNVPEPVFFCSVEADSPRQQKALDVALALMTREDPSLTVTTNPETGQLVMGGMGELHLEVVVSRLLSQHGVTAGLGKLQVAYREELNEVLGEEEEDRETRGLVSVSVDKTIGDIRQHVELTLAVTAESGLQFTTLELLHTRDNGENLGSLQRPRLRAVVSGVVSALSGGPVLGRQVRGARVRLVHLTVSRRTSDAFVAAVVGKCLKQVLETRGCRLTEPVMFVAVTAEAARSGDVLPDLYKRGAEMLSVQQRDDYKYIEALVPLASLIGYSSALRRLTSGCAQFTMHLHEYRMMTPHQQGIAVKQETGFYPT